jgi:hypothetical protein
VQFLPGEGGRLTRALWSLALALAVSGCVAGTRITATHEDYRLYRDTRLATTTEERLGASHRYLARMPEGNWADEVRSWFRLAEPAYYKASLDSAPRLRAYLLAMPDGPHAAAVTSRLVELETAAGFDEARNERELGAARRVQSNLALAAEQRRTFVRDIADLLGRLAAIESYGKPTSALDGNFLLYLRLQDPAAVCDERSCTKSLVARYQIPGGGTLLPREAPYQVSLALADGVLARVELSGPELWSRLGEALELQAVERDRPQTRVEAIGRVLPLLTNTLEAKFPADRCSRDAVSPTILERVCDGRRVSAVAGGDGEIDRVTFEPAPASEESDGG